MEVTVVDNILKTVSHKIIFLLTFSLKTKRTASGILIVILNAVRMGQYT